MDPYYSKYIKYKSKYDDLKLKNGINTSENNSKSPRVIESNSKNSDIVPTSTPIQPVPTTTPNDSQSNSFSDIFKNILPTSTPTSPVTTQPVTTQPVATQPVIIQPVATQPVIIQPVATQPVATQPVATQPVIIQPVATQPVTTQPVTTQPVDKSIDSQSNSFSDIFDNILPTSTPASPVVTKPIATSPVATQPVATSPVATSPVATQPVTTSPVATQPVATQPVATQPVATQPVATQPVATQPIDKSIDSQSNSLSDIFDNILPTSTPTSPVVTKPIATSPVTTSPVTTSPVTTSPVVTKPVVTSPVATSPVTNPIDIKSNNLSDIFNDILPNSTPTTPVNNQPIETNSNNKTLYVDPAVVNQSPSKREYDISNSDTSSELNNDTSSNNNMYKMINGVKYSNLEEYQGRVMCWFETCDLTWNNATWSK